VHQVRVGMDLIRRRLHRSAAVGTAAACALLLSACTSSSTSTVAPTTDKCQIGAASTPTSFGAAGGPGSVTISTARDCTWSIAADAPWLALTGDHSGQGEAVVPYTVAANTVPAQRSGSILVGSEKVLVSQAAAPCRYDLSRTADSIGAAGGHLSVAVTTLTGCGWNATTTAPWITVSSGQSGNANGAVSLTIAANAAGGRSGIVNVAGQSYTVNQEGAPAPVPDPTPAPTPEPPPTPTPTPTPPPPPPPPPPDNPVQFDAIVLGLSGQCPDVSFAAGLYQVVANSDTDYKHGRCGDLSNGDHVTVEGTARGTTVTAALIELKGKDSDR
jgi:hypothetical protein